MRIQIMLDAGVPQELTPEKAEVCPKRPIEDEVRDSLELIESDRESSIEFRAIRGLYSQLTKMKQTARVRNLRDMLRPVLAKYGYFNE